MFNRQLIAINGGEYQIERKVLMAIYMAFNGERTQWRNSLHEEGEFNV